ncbi:MAG TPA: TAT-variant-translocated molybdopterin oxidoreductase [Bryobacteraceae bacterium]|jgi:molybdopterin-containing oxidoreductase family iron-sulfur binding subunit
MSEPKLKLEDLRRRLSGLNGPQYWRSLEELAGTDEFKAYVEEEFPNRTPDWNDPGSRRRFFKLMGASMALAGLAACTKQPREAIVPYVRQPEEVTPGKPMFYATSMTSAGIATGVLAESHLGRPTKIEGNPDHPASLGATDIFMQASVLTLYDPDRSQAVLKDGFINSWGNFLTAISGARDVSDLKKGEGFRILTGTVTSPTLAEQIQQFLTTYPNARWHQWDPCGRHSEFAGSTATFGGNWNTIYRFDRAARVVSLDADFLAPTMPGSLRYTREYSTRRSRAADDPSVEAPRLYVAESVPSITGGMAEHRFRMRSADVEQFADSLLSGSGGKREQAIMKDLEAHRGASIVIAGEFQPPRVHAIAHALNRRLGNVGNTVYYTDRVEARPVDQLASLGSLTADMRGGQVETLLILGGNPAYDAPDDLDFLTALKHVKLRAHVGLFHNETSEWCHWHVPEAHYLESWSDARAWDGTASIVQPLIDPMYQGRTPHDVLNVLNKKADQNSHDTVRAYWQKQHPGKDFDDFWRICLHDGVVAGTAFPEKNAPEPKIPERSTGGTLAPTDLEVVFRPDPSIGDGAFSNNAWLQELPKQPNKMTWENAIWISPRTAQRLSLETGDVVDLRVAGRTLRGACWVQPGHADESLTLHLGYGRRRSGRISNGIGFNAYLLRTTNAMAHNHGASVTRVSRGYGFANTQITQTMEERDPFRAGTFAEYHKNPEFASPPEDHVPPGMTLFPMWSYPDHKWGMSIDLTACTGCNACMVACQSENNIAIVGKEQVAMGRHMNWIRVDRYFSGDLDDPKMYFQPVPCMHCENALCELVCPVAATVHSKEGLNEMVYNRCVGTRYCSNNCPYKVRRFNFFLFSDWQTPSLWGLRNPDVSVRSRGVMEKCSYCVQRIERAKIEAEEDNNRPLKDGEIVTACQQACPAHAIVFGDINNPKSEVTRLKKLKRNYLLLEDLNTRPRTTYLARLRNPNPEIEKDA